MQVTGSQAASLAIVAANPRSVGGPVFGSRFSELRQLDMDAADSKPKAARAAFMRLHAQHRLQMDSQCSQALPSSRSRFVTVANDQGNSRGVDVERATLTPPSTAESFVSEAPTLTTPAFVTA